MEDVAAKHYIRILRDMVHTIVVVKNVGVLWTKNTHIYRSRKLVKRQIIYPSKHYLYRLSDYTSLSNDRQV